MLEIHKNGKIEINPNEEIRRQFIEVIDQCDEVNVDVYDTVYDILQILKVENYFQYCVTLKLMYKDVYTYFNYINKTNETNKIDKYHIALISSCSADEVIQKIENNIDFIIENFVYVVTLNNMFQVKMILELNSTQHQYLTQVLSYHLYDLIALDDYIGFKILEDYYFKNINSDLSDEEDMEEEAPEDLLQEEQDIEEDDYFQETISEEIIEDIINFLEELHYKHPSSYIKIINDVIKRIYQWSYYYFENSIEVEEADLEIRVLRLINGCSIEKIGIKLIENKLLLGEILLRIFDDMQMGYPNITTSKGTKTVSQSDLDEYMNKIKRK